jgi:hypothetical protein
MVKRLLPGDTGSVAPLTSASPSVDSAEKKELNLPSRARLNSSSVVLRWRFSIDAEKNASNAVGNSSYTRASQAAAPPSAWRFSIDAEKNASNAVGNERLHTP